MTGYWDPLVWFLRYKEWVLKSKGFVRCEARIDEEPFGYYFRAGDPSAPLVVLVHGLALFPEWWEPLLPHIPEKYSVCIPELLGFGRSPGRGLQPDRFKIRLFSRQIAHLQRTLDIDSMILCGVSLGGWVSLDYALREPDRVKGLVLLGSAGADPDVREEDLQSLREVFDYNNAAEFTRLMNDYVFYKPRWLPAFLGALAVKRSRWNGHKHFLNHLTFDDWIGARALSLQMPVAMVWGKEDKVFPVETGRKLAKALPRAKLIELSETGHSYLFERPEISVEGIMEGVRFVEGEGAEEAEDAEKSSSRRGRRGSRAAEGI